MGKAKTVKKFMCGKLIYGHLIMCAVDWQMIDILAWPTAFYTGTSSLDRELVKELIYQKNQSSITAVNSPHSGLSIAYLTSYI